MGEGIQTVTRPGEVGLHVLRRPDFPNVDDVAGFGADENSAGLSGKGRLRPVVDPGAVDGPDTQAATGGRVEFGSSQGSGPSVMI